MIEAFTTGLAGTMIAAAVLTVVAIVAVALLWPRRSAPTPVGETVRP